MIDRDKLIKGCVIMAAFFTMLAFAEWRYSKSSWESMKYVAIESEAEKEAESAALESEKRAEYEATTTKPIVIKIETEAPTMPETSQELLTETTSEESPLEDMPPSASESLKTDLTETDDNFIVETTENDSRPILTQNTACAIMTPDEEQLIMRVASCEAGNQGWIGMALVMRVVLNRREAYGMSISDVIYAPRQFSVIGCNKWNSGFIAEEAPIALQAVKDGWDGSQGALFFCAPTHNKWHRSALTYLFTGWGHEFYK